MIDKLKATFSQWDTDVFGIKVGLLTLDQMVDRKFIKESNKEFEVVFVKAEGWHDPVNFGLHHRVWGVDWQYDMEVLHPPHKVIGEPAVMKLNLPLASHLQIAEAAFCKISRFSSDIVLEAKVPEFYRRWLSDKSVWALEGQQREDGFLLQTFDEDQVPRIALIGVAEKYRGLGVGERLILGAMNKLENAKAWRVKVSSKNWRALRFYEGLGFRVKSVTTAFHIWTH